MSAALEVLGTTARVLVIWTLIGLIPGLVITAIRNDNREDTP